MGTPKKKAKKGKNEKSGTEMLEGQRRRSTRLLAVGPTSASTEEISIGSGSEMQFSSNTHPFLSGSSSINTEERSTDNVLEMSERQRRISARIQAACLQEHSSISAEEMSMDSNSNMSERQRSSSQFQATTSSRPSLIYIEEMSVDSLSEVSVSQKRVQIQKVSISETHLASSFGETDQTSVSKTQKKITPQIGAEPVAGSSAMSIAEIPSSSKSLEYSTQRKVHWSEVEPVAGPSSMSSEEAFLKYYVPEKPVAAISETEKKYLRRAQYDPVAEPSSMSSEEAFLKYYIPEPPEVKISGKEKILSRHPQYEALARPFSMSNEEALMKCSLLKESDFIISDREKRLMRRYQTDSVARLSSNITKSNKGGKGKKKMNAAEIGEKQRLLNESLTEQSTKKKTSSLPELWQRPPDVYLRIWQQFLVRGRGLRNRRAIERYVIRDVLPSDYDKCIIFFKKHIIKGEAVFKDTGISNDKAVDESLKRLFEFYMRQKICLGCFLTVDDVPKELVALSLQLVKVRGRSSNSEELDCLTSMTLRTLLYIVVDLERHLNVCRQYSVERYMSCRGVYVHPLYRSKNIGFRMMQARVKMCEELNIPAAVDIFMSKISKLLAAKFNYLELALLIIDDLLSLGMDLSKLDAVYIMGIKFPDTIAETRV